MPRRRASFAVFFAPFLLAGCHLDSLMNDCRTFNNASCVEAARLMRPSDPAKAKEVEDEYRKTELTRCASPQQWGKAAAECASGEIWWTASPLAGEKLATLCNSGDTLACLNLADAHVLGRGVPEDAGKAKSLYEVGCLAEKAPSRTEVEMARRSKLLSRPTTGFLSFLGGSWGDDHHVYGNEPLPPAQQINCHRLESSGNLFDEGVEPRFGAVVPDGATWLGHAKQLIAAGKFDLAVPVLHEIVATSRFAAFHGEAKSLAEGGFDRGWEAIIAPGLLRKDYFHALPIAERMVGSLSPGDPARARVAALRVTAAAFFAADAKKAGQLTAGIDELVTAHFDPTRSHEAFDKAFAVATRLTARRSPVGADCSWLAPQQTATVEFDGVLVPVTLALHCKGITSPTTLDETTVIPGSPAVAAQTVNSTDTTQESYPCWKSEINGYGKLGPTYHEVMSSCTREVAHEHKEHQDAVAAVPDRFEHHTVEGTTVTVGIEGTIRVGARPVVPFSAFENGRAPKASEGATVLEFEIHTNTTLNRKIQAELDEIEAVRTKATRAEALRLGASAPSSERDEALAAAFLQGQDVPPVVTWLAERFNMTPAEMDSIFPPPSYRSLRRK